jgi:hypothetical protein
MKALKIALVVIVVAAICTGIYYGIQRIGKVNPVVIDGSEKFRKEIEKQIVELKVMPFNKDCKAFYKVVTFNINDFYKPSPPQHPFGRFGKTQLENDQRKESFEKELFAAYADKFIKHAKAVFHGSEWNPNDLKFIQAEMNELKKSKLLEPGNPRNIEFNSFQNALDKYNEIVSFISSCKDFRYSNTELIASASFPIADVQSKILRAASLRNNDLENNWVNNCTRLHDGLKEVPQALFDAHVLYLDELIDNWSGMYPNFNSQRDYSNNLYKLVKAKIDALDNDTYNVSNFKSEYIRLLQKWSDDNTKAFKHFN